MHWDSIIAEYSNVFETPGMPAEHKTVHRIKLKPGSVPLYKQQNRGSAAELSESVGIRIGIRKPGWNRVVMKINAICAKVSKLEISFCKFSCIGISRSEKSALHRGMLNHLQTPDGK